MTVVILRNALPPTLLGGWLAIFFAINWLRLSASRKFLATPPATRATGPWPRLAVIGHFAGGAAWGTLGCVLVLLRPDAPAYLLVLLFVIAIFAVAQAVSPSRYPPAYYAWVTGAIVPPMAAAMKEGGEVFVAAVAVGLLFIGALAIIARSTHRMMVEAVAREIERARLLESLLQQKEALDEAVRAKTQFLAAASHDLRQPMQAITLLVESLQDRAREPETRAIVESIRSSVSTMARLLNAILDISRFDAGTVRPERSHFALAPLLERVRHIHAEAAAEKGLVLRVARTRAVAETDPVLLYRILGNLVSNAVRYTESGGVLIGCRHRGDGLVVEVWDTGPGIAESQQREIFREFVQVGNPHRDREQGLGLGLAIVERTARLLGHDIALRSRPGRGSVFALAIGRGDPERMRPLGEAAAGAPLGGCSVLVVDDDREVRAAMALLLEGWGCAVHVADSGAQARDQLARLGEGPDIAIADYRLPGEENGVEVLDAIRRRFPATGGILVSGDIGPEALRRAQDSGYTLLHKPLRPARLRALMGNLWRSRAAAAETLRSEVA